MTRYIAFLLCMMVNVTAYADDAPQWQFSITPYLWLGGVHSAYTRAGTPTLSGKTDIGSILPHLTTFPIMGAGEVRYGRLALGFDVVALSAQFPTHLEVPTRVPGMAKVNEVQVSVVGAYRVVETAQQTVDLGLGLQAWRINTGLQFGPASLGNHASWIDPILAGRYRFALPANFGISLYGTLGGLSGAKLTYQVLAAVDYRATRWMTLRAGYRYSYFDYQGKPIRFNATLNGPIVGATFRF